MHPTMQGINGKKPMHAETLISCLQHLLFVYQNDSLTNQINSDNDTYVTSTAPIWIWPQQRSKTKHIQFVMFKVYNNYLCEVGQRCWQWRLCALSGVTAMRTVDVLWAAIVSWGHADSIIRLKNRKDLPAVNFLHCRTNEQVQKCQLLTCHMSSCLMR